MKPKTQATILIIEDDLDTADLVSAFLKQKDYETIVYGDAQKVMDDLTSQKLKCDVIITDLNLPNISGIELTKKMKSSELDIPIILVTADKAVETAVEAIAAGAYDFVVKPLHFPQLLVSIQRALYLRQVKEDNSTLRTVVQSKDGSSIEGIIGKSAGFKQALDLAQRVSKSSANVFISGESGTGKEVIAKAIHSMGVRKNGPFIAINCSSIPENLLESELFGHAKGAFTGACDKKIGLFEEAEGGTLFLDEIGDLSPLLQAKLLRVLQERKIKRIGENQFRNIDVRILSATHKDLRKEIVEDKFREDLFFRLNVIHIKIPPLRERKEDILPLAEFFLKKFKAVSKSPLKGFSKSAMEFLLENPWRGNVRELENAVERAVVLCGSDYIQPEDLSNAEEFNLAAMESAQNAGFPIGEHGQVLTVDELVKKYIQFVLDKNSGAKEKTAKDLDIDRKTLYRKLNDLGIQAN